MNKQQERLCSMDWIEYETGCCTNRICIKLNDDVHKLFVLASDDFLEYLLSLNQIVTASLSVFKLNTRIKFYTNRRERGLYDKDSIFDDPFYKLYFEIVNNRTISKSGKTDQRYPFIKSDIEIPYKTMQNHIAQTMDYRALFDSMTVLEYTRDSEFDYEYEYEDSEYTEKSFNVSEVITEEYCDFKMIKFDLD